MFASYFFAAGILPLLISMQAAGGIPISFHTIFIPMLQWLAGFLPIYPNRMVLFNDFEQGWYVSSTKNVVLVAVLSFNLSSITKVMFSIFR